MITTRPWHGVVAKLNTASVDNRVLSLPPDTPLPHRTLPLPLGVVLPDEDRICGTTTNLWQIANTVYGTGNVEIDTDTRWGERLLAGEPAPVGVAAHHADMHVDIDDDGDWWNLGHEPLVPHPQVLILTSWSIATIKIQDNAAWPGVFLRLTPART